MGHMPYFALFLGKGWRHLDERVEEKAERDIPKVTKKDRCGMIGRDVLMITDQGFAVVDEMAAPTANRDFLRYVNQFRIGFGGEAKDWMGAWQCCVCRSSVI